jgi:hypothetical protein
MAHKSQPDDQSNYHEIRHKQGHLDQQPLSPCCGTAFLSLLRLVSILRLPGCAIPTPKQRGHARGYLGLLR